MDATEPLIHPSKHSPQPESVKPSPRRSLPAGGDPPEFELSRRESEVLNHIRLGLTNRQIAERLFVSTNTINKHVGQVLKKLAVSNRVQAATFARDLAI